MCTAAYCEVPVIYIFTADCSGEMWLCSLTTYFKAESYEYSKDCDHS